MRPPPPVWKVTPGNVTNSPPPRPLPRRDPGGELTLQAPRLRRREIQPMQLLGPHQIPPYLPAAKVNDPDPPSGMESPPEKDRPDRWNLEGGTVPSAGARFNLNITLTLLQCPCIHVTALLRNGNTLVTKSAMWGVVFAGVCVFLNVKA